MFFSISSATSTRHDPWWVMCTSILVKWIKKWVNKSVNVGTQLSLFLRFTWTQNYGCSNFQGTIGPQTKGIWSPSLLWCRESFHGTLTMHVYVQGGEPSASPSNAFHSGATMTVRESCLQFWVWVCLLLQLEKATSIQLAIEKKPPSVCVCGV